MRELKFRAWSEETRTLYSSDDIREFPLEHIKNGDVWTFEQYTGLKDKNGKEIYEGDILGGIWEGGCISYCEKCKQFQYHSCGECMACSGDVHWYEIVEDDEKLEVIGNIHENPELLGEEEE